MKWNLKMYYTLWMMLELLVTCYDGATCYNNSEVWVVGNKLRCYHLPWWEWCWSYWWCIVMATFVAMTMMLELLLMNYNGDAYCHVSHVLHPFGTRSSCNVRWPCNPHIWKNPLRRKSQMNHKYKKLIHHQKMGEERQVVIASTLRSTTERYTTTNITTTWTKENYSKRNINNKWALIGPYNGDCGGDDFHRYY